MGSPKDKWETYKKTWKEAPLSLNIWICISSFLGISSVTSISEKIIDWRGFIRDGLDLYQEYIRNPIAELLSSFGLVFAENAIDYLLLWLLLQAGLIRSDIPTIMAGLKSDNSAARSVSFQIIRLHIFVPGSVLIFLILILGFFGHSPPLWVFVALLAGSYLPAWYFENNLWAISVPLIIAIAGTCILAAVNLGLSS